MKSNVTTLNSILKLKTITQSSHFALPLHYISRNWFHLHFFTYRYNFFSNRYNLLSSHISEFQLTYMDNMWEELIPLNHRKEKLSKLTSNIYKLKNISFCKAKFTRFQLLTLILKPRNFFLTSYIPYRLSTKYLTSYYTFLNTRVGFNKRNYMQRFVQWSIFSLKTSITQSVPHISHKKLKHLRRTKIRTLRKSQTSLQNTSYIVPFISGATNKLPILFTLTPSTLIFKVGMNNEYFKKPILSYKKTKIRKFLRKLGKAKPLNTQTSYMYVALFEKRPNLISRYYNNRTLKFYKKIFWLKKYSLSNQNTYFRVAKVTMVSQSKHLNRKLVQPLFYNSDDLSHLPLLDLDSPLQIATKSLNSFILRNKGFNVISQVLRKNTFPYKLKSQFKKKLFSFIYPGQSKKNVLIRRKKQVLTRLLSKSTQLISSLDKFSYRLFYQLFTSDQFMFKKNQILQKDVNQSILTYNNNLRNVYYTFDYNTKGIDVGDLYINSEVRIPRIRFKPGYQRIWRQVRSALKVSLNVKFQYQQQLTKYLTKFYHLSSQYLLSYSESTLDKIVVYSQLLPDVSTTELFSSHGFIYVNGHVTTTINTILIKNDFLQLVVSLWYYIITRWFLNWTNARIRKFKRLVYRKNKPLQYKIMKNKKQQSYYTPNWIYQTRYDNTDVKPYLEVDFFTLSAFILTDTYIQYYHKIDDMPDLRNSTYILYNWKYIT